MDARRGVTQSSPHPSENQYSDNPSLGEGNEAQLVGGIATNALPHPRPGDDEPVTRAEFRRLTEMFFEGVNQILQARHPAVPVTMPPNLASGGTAMAEPNVVRRARKRLRQSKPHKRSRRVARRVVRDAACMLRARSPSPSDPVDSKSNTLSGENDDGASRRKRRLSTPDWQSEGSRSRVSTSKDRSPPRRGRTCRTTQPFTRNVIEDYCPNHVRLPSLDSYDGTEDPEDHLNHYEIRMSL
ncbi:hypothetical protein Dimus_038051 [Dionaea muscipula]